MFMFTATVVFSCVYAKVRRCTYACRYLWKQWSDKLCCVRFSSASFDGRCENLWEVWRVRRRINYHRGHPEKVSEKEHVGWRENSNLGARSRNGVSRMLLHTGAGIEFVSAKAAEANGTELAWFGAGSEGWGKRDRKHGNFYLIYCERNRSSEL